MIPNFFHQNRVKVEGLFNISLYVSLTICSTASLFLLVNFCKTLWAFRIISMTFLFSWSLLDLVVWIGLSSIFQKLFLIKRENVSFEKHCFEDYLMWIKKYTFRGCNKCVLLVAHEQYIIIFTIFYNVHIYRWSEIISQQQLLPVKSSCMESTSQTSQNQSNYVWF